MQLYERGRMSDIQDTLEFYFKQTQQSSYRMAIKNFQNGNMCVIFTNTHNSERVKIYLERVTTIHNLTRFEIKSMIHKRKHLAFAIHFENFLFGWSYYNKRTHLRFGA